MSKTCAACLAWKASTDMSDVTYLDPTALGFLAECEANGIVLRNCPIYLREWIDKEKEKNPQRKQ